MYCLAGTIMTELTWNRTLVKVCTFCPCSDWPHVMSSGHYGVHQETLVDTSDPRFPQHLPHWPLCHLPGPRLWNLQRELLRIRCRSEIGSDQRCELSGLLLVVVTVSMVLLLMLLQEMALARDWLRSTLWVVRVAGGDCVAVVIVVVARVVVGQRVLQINADMLGLLQKMKLIGSYSVPKHDHIIHTYLATLWIMIEWVTWFLLYLVL